MTCGWRNRIFAFRAFGQRHCVIFK
jgi:hypothetical protein